MKIYIAIPDYNNQAVLHLKEYAEVVVATKRPTESELCEIVKIYDCIIIGIKESFTARVYENIKNLSIIATLSIGTDHIAEVFKEDSKITIINSPTANVASVAEHTFALILALIKQLFPSYESALKNERPDLNTYDLFSKTLGVIGAGNIGTRVIEIGIAFGMEIKCFTFLPENHKELKLKGVEFVDLDELMKVSDIISVHLPLTVESHNIINSDLLKLLKPSSIFINTSRNDIVDLDFLIDLLEKEKLSGVGLDIDLDIELTRRLGRLKRCVFTKHMAGSSEDANNRTDFYIADQIVKIICRDIK